MNLLRGLPPTLRFFFNCVVALAGGSLLYTAILGFVLRRPYPYGLPLFGGLKTFSDFNDFAERFAHFRTDLFWAPFNSPFAYPAPLAVVLGWLFKLPDPLATYLDCYAVVVIAAGLLLARRLVQAGCSMPSSLLFTATLVLTSWPLFFVICRGNIEAIDALSLAIGVVAVLAGYPFIGAIAIGVAGAMKIYPLVLTALLISQRQFKQVAAGLVAALTVTVLSLAYLGPTLLAAAHHVADGLTYFKRLYSERMQWPDYDHSLFALYKTIFGTLHRSATYVPYFPNALKVYMAVVAIGGVTLYFTVIRRRPILNQIIALCVCAVTMPPVSYDYTLINLVLPCGLLCIYAAQAEAAGRRVAGLKAAFVCFAVIFTWGTFLNVDGVKIAGQVRTLALLSLLTIVLRYPFVAVPQGGDSTAALA